MLEARNKVREKGPILLLTSSVGDSSQGVWLPCTSSTSFGTQVLQKDLGSTTYQKRPLREDFLEEETSNMRYKITKKRQKLHLQGVDLWRRINDVCILRQNWY